MGAEKQEAMGPRRRGCTSTITQRILRWLNYSIIAASVITIICMLALRLVPTAWGWGFLSFSFLSIASAIVGCISTRGLCYSLHMFLLISSICVQGSVFLLLITRPGSVLDKFRSNRSDYDGRVLLKVDAALLLWIFCVQMVVLAMACIVHCCEPVDFYEDLEGNVRIASHRSRRRSRVQEESIADVEAGKESKTSSEASRLQTEMKEKYSQKKKETEEEGAHENVEI